MATETTYRKMLIRAWPEGKDFFWNIYRDNRFYLHDFRTADGERIQSEAHAINDAKRNIDIILRIDHFKYYNKPECDAN